MKLLQKLGMLGNKIEDYIDNLGAQACTTNTIEAQLEKEERKEENLFPTKPGSVITEEGEIKLDNGNILVGKLIFNGNALKEEEWTKEGLWQAGMFEDKRVIALKKPQSIYVTIIKEGKPK